MTPCLSPLAPFRNDIHVLSGVDNAAAKRHGQRPHQLDERPDDLHARSPAAARADRRSTR